MDLRLIIVLCALAATRAVPQSEIVSGQCAIQCQSSELNELNEYPTGQTHKYKFTTQTFVDSWNSKVDLQGEVLLTRSSPCDYSLEISKVAVNGIPETQSWEKQLVAQPLRFAWVNGQISNVCQHPEDPEWAVNVKKAIASSLQVVQTSGYTTKTERDILGDCFTTYQQADLANDRIVIEKSKDIASCQYHHDDKIAAAISSLILNTPHKAQYQCKQIWNSRYILKSVSCGHVASTQTQVVSNLTMELVGTEQRASIKSLESFRRSQLYASRVHQPKRSIVEVTQTMKNLCKDIENQIQSKTPSTFIELVRDLEHFNYNEIKQMWGSISQQCASERSKRFVVDALLQTRSGPTLKFLIKDLSKSRDVSEMKLKAAIYSLVYKPEPCSETMEALQEYLRSERPVAQTLFGVTAAIQKYYELTGDKKQALVNLELILARFNRASENEKVLYVRALSNIRFETNILIKALEQYIESGKPELRVAVIETLELLDACNDRVYGKVRQMVMSTSQPNEVRTRALRVLLRCGDEEFVSQLKSYIESHPEDVNFISYADSYLRNAMRTMNVDKQVIRQNALSGRSQWKQPRMTLSRNIEFSQRAILRKVGFNYEIDSIVENDKKMPTWVVLNSSIAIQKANQINFEIGLRQEGMDKLAIVLFEKMTKIEDQQIEKIVDEIQRRHDFEPIIRELTKIVEEVRRMSGNSPQFSAYIKVNGIALFYWNSASSSIEIQDLDQFFREAFVENTETRKAIEASLGWMLFDYQLNKPLVSGLTFRYRHEGSFVPVIKASLKSQAATATSSKRVLELVPNFAVTFAYGHELVLGKPIASQLTQLNVHTDFAIQALYSLSQSGFSKVLSLVFEPREEMNLLRLEVSKITRDSYGNEIKDHPSNHNIERCSTAFTDRLFGYAVCYGSQEQAHAILEKRNAQVVRRLYIKKTDKSLKTYEFVLRLDRNEAALSFNTPNTHINRKVEIVFGRSGDFNQMKNSAGKFWVSVETPIKSLDVNVSVALPSDEKWIVTIDTQLDRRVHSARLSMEPRSNGQYIVNLMATSPLLREKIDYDLTFAAPQNSEGRETMAQIHSNMGNKRNRLALIKMNRSKQGQNKFEFELNSQRGEKLVKISLDGEIRKDTRSPLSGLHYSGKAEYRRALGKMEEVSVSGSYKIDNTGEAKSITNNLEVKTTQWPTVNGKVTHKIFYKSNEHLENDVEIRYGRDYKEESTLNRMILRQVSSKKTGAKNTVEIKNSLIAEHRANQFNHKVEGRATFTPQLEVLKVEMTHSDLNDPKNNHKMVIDHKTTANSEGTLNLVLSASPVSRSFKTSYALTSSPKLNTIYKVEKEGRPTSGYHVSAALNKALGKNQANVEVLTYPENKQIIRLDADLNQPERSRIAANLKVSLRERNLLSAEYDRNGHQIKSKIASPVGSVDSLVDMKAKSFKLITKNSKDMTHELSAVNSEEVKSIKSTTLSGPKNVPSFELKLGGRNHLEFNLQTSKVDASLDLKKTRDAMDMKYRFQCGYHNDDHSTVLKWNDQHKLLTSVHKRDGKQIYNFELHGEQKNDLVHKLILSVGQNFETRVQHVYNAEKRLSKFDVIANKENFQAKIISKVALPAKRFSRALAAGDMPRVELKASMNYDGKESLVLITNEQIHLQHRNRYEVPFVMNSKVESNKWSLVGHMDQFKWNIAVVPRGAQKLINLNVEGYGTDMKLNLSLHEESSQWKVNTQSKLIFRDTKIADGQVEGVFAKTLITGPHKIVIKSKNQVVSLTYKLPENKLDIAFDVNANGQKLIAAQFNGEKYQRGRVRNLSGKLELTSEKYEALRNTAYEVKYNREGRKVEVDVEKRGSNPMNMKLNAEIAREAAQVTAVMSGRTASGKQRKLNIEYNRSNKIDFSAKLSEMSKVDSEMSVSLPLVKIAEFIGNEVSFHLRSKSFDTEASFKLQAPSSTSVTGSTNLKIQGQQWLQSSLAINDGSSIQFFGLEKVNNKLENPIAISTDFYFKGKQIFLNNLLISDNLISLKAESPILFKINQAFTLNRTPEVFGKYCLRSQCFKMSSKWILEQKGFIQMNIETPNDSAQQYDASFKWNKEHGKEYGSALVSYSGRQYGYEMSRSIKNAKNSVYESKVTLPKRVMAFTVTKDEKAASNDKYQGTWQLVLRPKENADDLKITFDQSVKASGSSSNNLKADYAITVEHKTLSNPIKLVSSVNMVRSEVSLYNIWGIQSADVKMGLNLNGFEEPDFNGAFHMEMVQNKLNYNWRIWQKEKKVDLGCKGLFSSSGSFRSQDKQFVNKYDCHYVNRNNERKEFKREQAFNMNDLIALKKGLPKITFHDNIEHPSGSYFYNGTFHLLDAIKNATITFGTNEKSRYQLDVKMNTHKTEKCLEFTLFSAENAAEKYGLRSCLNLKAQSEKSVFTFEIFTFGNQVSMTEGERKVDLSIKRMRENINDYLIRMNWDTNSMAQATYQAVDFLEQASNERSAFIRERNDEIKAKVEYLRSSIGNKIQNTKNYFSKDFNNLANEMKVEGEAIKKMLSKSSRTRRAVGSPLERHDVDISSKMSYEWRVQDLENGNLELVVRNVEIEKIPLFVYEVLLQKI